jgi:hypothetical protein
MGSVWVKQFTGGLDTRRLPETTPGGTLIKAIDGHITLGGEFEGRAAFVSTYTLPAGTIGMAHTPTGLVVFGSSSAPTLPDGVSYQQLVHPDGSTAMTALLSATLFSGKIYAVAQFADATIEHYYDGARVTDWFDGRARASFRVTGGASATADKLSDLRVNGVAVISAAVPWNTDQVQTAADIAAAINSDTSTPDYSATSVGNQVNIVAAVAGTAPNGRVVTPVLLGALTVTPTSGIAMAGGSDNTATYTPGGFATTIGSKIYAVADTELHFSGVAAPTKFTSDVTGAGFIDMAQYDSESTDLVAVSNYQSYIAVFGSRTVQIWYVDPDPSLNRKSQVLKNTGTESPLSVTEFGTTDVFYLDESGMRSLRSVMITGLATTADIGTPIDTLIKGLLQGFSATDRLKIVGLVNPVDRRFWLIMGSTIMVFSYFVTEQISAWTQYLPGFTVEYATVFNRRVYVRSVDAAVLGQWSVSAGMDPTNLVAEDLIATIPGTTYGPDAVPMNSQSSHISLRFRGQGAGRKVLSSATIHFDGEEDD